MKAIVAGVFLIAAIAFVFLASNNNSEDVDDNGGVIEDVQIVAPADYKTYKEPVSTAKFKTYYPAVAYSYPGLTKTVKKARILSIQSEKRIHRLSLRMRVLKKRISRLADPATAINLEVNDDRQWLLSNLKDVRREISRAKLELAQKKGPTGVVGKNGKRGPVGRRGRRGEKGPTGIRGFQGVHGIEGLQGNAGVQGQIGARGPTGSRGPHGPAGVPSVRVGPTGDRGAQGAHGKDGRDVVGRRGPPGPPGLPGRPGPNGREGPRGVEGVRGFGGVSGEDGLTGRDGLSLFGAAGKDGADGAAGVAGAGGQGGPNGGAAGERLIHGAIVEMWFLGGDTPNLNLPFVNPNRRWVFTQNVIDINDPGSFGLPDGRRELFALRYLGVIRIPHDGDYKFFTSSDDGSKFYVDGRLVVDNDGLHGAQERAGGIHLSTGIHTFRLDFFQNYGGGSLKLFWEGPNINKRLVDVYQPVARRRTAILNRPLANYGFYCEVRRFGGEISSLGGLFNGGPASTKTYTTPFINFPDANSFEAGTTERFSTQYTGYITAPTTGRYQFWMVSDDGSQLFIDNQLVVNNDGLHPPQWRDGAIDLPRGNHAIKVLFFQNGGGGSLRVDWAGPGISRGFMPVLVSAPPNIDDAD